MKADTQTVMAWWNEKPMQDIMECRHGWANLVMIYYPEKTNCQDVTEEEITHMYEQEQKIWKTP